MSAGTWGGAPAGAIARPSGPTVAGVAVGAGVGEDACACAAVPPCLELGELYDVPPVGSASARPGTRTSREERTSATVVRRDISCSGVRHPAAGFLSWSP